MPGGWTPDGLSVNGKRGITGLSPFLQGNQLRKMLLQNYLQNRKSSTRGDLPDPMGTGQHHVSHRASQ